MFKHKTTSSLKAKSMSTITNTAKQQPLRDLTPNVTVKNVIGSEMDDSEEFNYSKPEHQDEEGFITPKRGKLRSRPTSPTDSLSEYSTPSKRYILDSSSLMKNNKFNSLSDHTYHLDAPEMDSDGPSSAVKLKIPPIFLHEANHHQEIIKDIKHIVKNDFTTGLKGNSLKINLTDITDFRNLTKFYEQSNLKFHTFQSPLDKKLEAVLRNVPLSLSEEEIKQELLDLGYPVFKVVRLMSKDKHYLPLCAVDLENNEDGRDIFKLNRLSHAVITVEPKRKNREIPQCLRCQRFGHTKNFCHLDPRCVRCTGQHMYSQCPLSKDIQPVCVNCGENHTANFRGCKHYQDLKMKTQNNNSGKPKGSKSTDSVPGADGKSSAVLSNDSSNTSNIRHSGTVPKGGSYSEVAKRSEVKSKNPLSSSSTSRGNDNETTNETLGNDNPMLTNFETIIMDLVKSCIPMLKQFFTKAIMSIFNNGSIQ